jgi:1,4-dihydroxy-2-naphthoate octaprenyltransferase
MSPSLRPSGIAWGRRRETGATEAGAAEAGAAESGGVEAAAVDAGTVEVTPAEPLSELVRLDRARVAAAGFPPVEVGRSHASGPAAETEDGPAEISDVEDALARLVAFEDVVLSWIAEDGYPMNVSVAVEVVPHDDLIRFGTPPGFQIPAGEVAVTGTHIRALPDGGFDERSHVTVWGTPTRRPRGRFSLRPERAWIRDEGATPPPAAYERDLPKARRYFDELSRERGYRVRPRLDLGLLLFRATRAPFLTATLVPVILGLTVAAQEGFFDALLAILTIVAASAVHLGLNVANDVFDTLAGADDANTNPTPFSGGSRVIQNALVSIGQMSVLAACCYGFAGAIGLLLLYMRGSTALVAIAAAGLVISLGYTMPPLKLVYRGWGEVATAIGFGPVMLLGAYVVQSGGGLSIPALVASLPVGLLVAMILYVNEIPDRISDARADKLTLPVRLGKREVILGFDVAVAATFAIVAAGPALGLLPLPCLLALMAIPLAREVHRGLVRFYDEPYALMPTMALNIRLHFTVGLLLWLGYVATFTDEQLLHLRPFLG